MYLGRLELGYLGQKGAGALKAIGSWATQGNQKLKVLVAIGSLGYLKQSGAECTQSNLEMAAIRAIGS